MKKEDSSVLVSLSLKDLCEKLASARREFASLKMNARVGQEKNTSSVRLARKNVARIQTAISKKNFLEA